MCEKLYNCFRTHVLCLGAAMENTIYIGDNLEILTTELSDGSVDLIYIDPPFNTRKSQIHTRIKTQRSENGDRVGYLGQSYRTVKVSTKSYADDFGDEYADFLAPRLQEACRVLAEHGLFYLHIDYREVHYCRLLLDQIFGRACFRNEIIWAYDFGGRPRNKWPAKHDNILVYSKSPDPDGYYFDWVRAAEQSYPAPNGGDKKEIGPSDVWWHTIVPTAGQERTGYPTQKPLGILNRIVETSSRPGDLVLDFFAGSGTTGESCLLLDRRFILIDENPQAVAVMQKRFAAYPIPYSFVQYQSEKA